MLLYTQNVKSTEVQFMTITLSNLRSMLKSRRFREQNGLAVSKPSPRKPNYPLVQKIMRDYIFPGDEEDTKKPPS